MDEPLIDIITTTYNRLPFLRVTVESLLAKNKAVPFRLFIYDDDSFDGTTDFLKGLSDERLQAVILGKQRMGVVYAFNQLWAFTEQLSTFVHEAPYLCYLQDDMESLEEEWLATLLAAFEAMEGPENVAFASGYDAPEHPTWKALPYLEGQILLKKSQPAQNLFGRRSFFQSIGYIPRINPDGSERGFPGNSRGSHIDLYLTGCQSGSKFVKGAAAPNCSYNQDKTILVYPGLLRHLGIEKKDSTWRQDREGGF